MSIQQADRLWALLPDLYRSRDDGLPDAPLRTLVDVLGGGLQELSDAIDQLADDRFVERASPDALPLLADLLGVQLIGSDPIRHRAQLARAIHWGRRRGVLATIEERVALTTGWSTEVDEAFRSLAHTQDVQAPVLWRGRTATVWDPIALADPLTRRGLPPDHRPGDPPPDPPTIGVLDGETLDDALTRLGRADAGRYAASPRTFDLRQGGSLHEPAWARPDVIVLRTDRMHLLDRERVVPGEILEVPTRDGAVPHRIVRLDPTGADTALAWLRPLERADQVPTLTEVHEPDPVDPTPLPTGATLLTPTELAHDAALVEEHGVLDLYVSGIQLVGPRPLDPPDDASTYRAPGGEQVVFGFAEPTRPGLGDVWRLEWVRAHGEDETVVVAVDADGTGPVAVAMDPDIDLPVSGASNRVRVRRMQGSATVRDVTGDWAVSTLGARFGTPLSNTVAWDGTGGPALLRLSRDPVDDSLALARVDGGNLPAGFVGEAIVGLPELVDAVLLAHDDALWVVASPAGAEGPEDVGLWRIPTPMDPAPTATRIDPAGLAPGGRLGLQAAIHGGRLVLVGGLADDESALDDLWSLALDGSEPWAPHAVRKPLARHHGQLLSTPAGLVLVGGAVTPGILAREVGRIDPGPVRVRWELLPELPLRDGPGTAIVRAVGSDLEALVWDDRTRPCRLAWADGEPAWGRFDDESDGPNPPAPGDAVFVGDQVWVVGPSPLPAFEVVLAGRTGGVLAFLPTLDLAPDPRGPVPDLGEGPDGSSITFDVTDGGSATAKSGASDPPDRHGDGPMPVPQRSRTADLQRYSAPGRLARALFSLHQRTLADTTGPYADVDPEVVGLDPRLGRVLLPPGAPRGEVRVSYRVGRTHRVGAGFMPEDRAPFDAWLDPDVELPTPPDLRDPSDHPRPITAWVDPTGALSEGPPSDAPVVADLAEGLTAPGDEPVLALVGSVHLPAARLTEGLDAGLSLVPTDVSTTPFLSAADDGGPSLALHADLGGDATTDVWLAGLHLAGGLQTTATRGDLDLRWCTLAAPGQLGLDVAGGGHERETTRTTLPEVTLEIRLVGCAVGRISLPPWARLVALGCTFDAGDRDAPAILAGGARVQLRHCTVHGGIQAGELKVDSSAITGRIRVDLPEAGWVRYSAIPSRGGARGRTPPLYRCWQGFVAFDAIDPADPRYLRLACNLPDSVLFAGEHGATPGVTPDHGAQLAALRASTAGAVPMGLSVVHQDRTRTELERMAAPGRRFP